jgi:spermidine synthase
MQELTAAGAPPCRVGVVGLGAGTLAAYGRAGDTFRFYELSPHVAELARTTFTFLADSPAESVIVPGDARLSLEREAASTSGQQQFDLLVLDAFSGDAIPVHLLTAEALDVYRRRLARGAVIAVHVSNNHLDLEPVVARHAARIGWSAVAVPNEEGDGTEGTLPSDWVLMAETPGRLDRLDRFRTVRKRPPRDDPTLPVWTDEYASLLRVLKGRGW